MRRYSKEVAVVWAKPVVVAGKPATELRIEDSLGAVHEFIVSAKDVVSISHDIKVDMPNLDVYDVVLTGVGFRQVRRKS